MKFLTIEQVRELQIIDRGDLVNVETVKRQRPPPVGMFYDSQFYQYVGTDCFQWYGAKGGSWTPYGKMLVLLREAMEPEQLPQEED